MKRCRFHPHADRDPRVRLSVPAFSTSKRSSTLRADRGGGGQALWRWGLASRFTTSLLAAVTAASAISCGGDEGEGFGVSSEMDQNLASSAGDYWEDYLTEHDYSKLLIEIDYVEGAEPDQDAIDTLVETIEMLCNKESIEVSYPDDVIPSSESAGPEYTYDEVENMEIAWRDNYRGDDTAVLYFLYVDGNSEYDDEESGTAVLGYAYHGSSMVIFMDTIHSYPSAFVQSDLIKTVTVHEFGHLIGLVDNGLDMVNEHDDPDHPPHCDNPDCMMYWLNNYSSIQDLLDGEIPDFDDNCLADIAAAGGKDARNKIQPK